MVGTSLSVPAKMEVQRAVRLVDAQAEVSIELGRKLLEVRSSAAQENIGEAIRKAGYENSAAAIT